MGSAAGEEAAFLDALKLCSRLVKTGYAKSLTAHPSPAIRRQLSSEELAKAGILEDAVRLSIGIEHMDDFLADLT